MAKTFNNMDEEDLKYWNNYKKQLNKFIFQEINSISVRQYVKLTDEVRMIESYLEENKKILSVKV